MLLKILNRIWGSFLALFFYLYTFLIAFVFVFLLLFFKQKSFHDWYVKNVWSRVLLWISGVKIKIQGLEHIKKDKGGLVLFNHASNFDILILFFCMPAVRFGAKSELFRVPFLAHSMRSIGILPIYRSNRNRVLEIYKQAYSRMNQGEFFALAPEGTRLDGGSIGEFKNGPFIFAVGAQAQIYPVVIKGANKVMAKNNFAVNPARWGGEVEVVILPPVSTENSSIEDVSKVREEVRNLMIEKFEALKG